MDIDIRLAGHNDQSNELRSDLRQRVHGALDRFAAGIGSVVVRMAGADELPAGGQKLCRISVLLTPSGVSITQEGRSDDVYGAVDRAVDSIRRFFSWQAQRAGGGSIRVQERGAA